MTILLDTNVVLDVLLDGEPFSSAEIIVTRDAHGFKKATLPVMTPAELLLSLEMG